jgi:hypothetical protein
MAKRGDIEGAKEAVAAASVLNDKDPKIEALKKALLEEASDGPLDVAPFLRQKR